VSRNTNVGIGVVAVLAVVVVLGPGIGLVGDNFGTPSRLDELGPDFADGRAEIEAIVDATGMGTFTAKAIAICGEGTILRLGSGRTTAVAWTEDEYRCGEGSFVLRIEWPASADTANVAANGTWTVTSGADDYGDLVGDGAAELSTTPGRPDVLIGTLGFDF